MDPFEEFEFKPLTEGLGFHNVNTPTSGSQKSKVDFNLELMAPDLADNVGGPQIQSPLPRKDPSRPSGPTKKPHPGASDTVDDILKTLGDRKKMDFLEPSSIQKRLPNHRFVSSHFEFSAALLDAMLIVASYLASMIILLVITKVDLFDNLMNPDQDGMIYLGLFGLFAILSWIYLVVNRVFLGYTPGEWVFDQRLGWPEQMGTPEYSLKVAARSTLMLLTGFVTVPLLSMIFRRDLMGKMLGVEILKKV